MSIWAWFAIAGGRVLTIPPFLYSLYSVCEAKSAAAVGDEVKGRQSRNDRTGGLSLRGLYAKCNSPAHQHNSTSRRIRANGAAIVAESCHLPLRNTIAAARPAPNIKMATEATVPTGSVTSRMIMHVAPINSVTASIISPVYQPPKHGPAWGDACCWVAGRVLAEEGDGARRGQPTSPPLEDSYVKA